MEGIFFNAITPMEVFINYNLPYTIPNGGVGEEFMSDEHRIKPAGNAIKVTANVYA
jgi:hypothetical protein